MIYYERWTMGIHSCIVHSVSISSKCLPSMSWQKLIQKDPMAFQMLNIQYPYQIRYACLHSCSLRSLRVLGSPLRRRRDSTIHLSWLVWRHETPSGHLLCYDLDIAIMQWDCINQIILFLTMIAFSYSARLPLVHIVHIQYILWNISEWMRYLFIFFMWIYLNQPIFFGAAYLVPG